MNAILRSDHISGETYAKHGTFIEHRKGFGKSTLLLSSLINSSDVGFSGNVKSETSLLGATPTADPILIENESIFDRWERILVSLSSIDSDDGAASPNHGVLSTVQKVAYLLPIHRLPETEFDDSTGFVTFRWFSRDDEKSFNMTITSEDNVVAALCPRPAVGEYKWRWSGNLEHKMLSVIDLPYIQEVLA